MRVKRCLFATKLAIKIVTYALLCIKNTYRLIIACKKTVRASGVIQVAMIKGHYAARLLKCRCRSTVGVELRRFGIKCHGIGVTAFFPCYTSEHEQCPRPVGSIGMQCQCCPRLVEPVGGKSLHYFFFSHVAII